MIGVHLMVDGETDGPVSEETVERILRDLPARIDMNILDGPYVVRGVPENPGLTGIEVIDKSHIAIHTFDENNTISVDVYSCKPFNAKKAVEYIKGMCARARATLQRATDFLLGDYKTVLSPYVDYWNRVKCSIETIIARAPLKNREIYFIKA